MAKQIIEKVMFFSNKFYALATTTPRVSKNFVYEITTLSYTKLTRVRIRIFSKVYELWIENDDVFCEKRVIPLSFYTNSVNLHLEKTPQNIPCAIDFSLHFSFFIFHFSLPSPLPETTSLAMSIR